MVRSSSKMTAKFDTMVDVFDHSRKRFADRPLFGTKRGGTWVWMTYSEFGNEVDRIVGAFHGLGAGKGDNVCIIADNRPEWAISAYGCFRVGSAIVPMYEAQSEKEWEYIVKESEAKILIVANRKILDRCLRFLTDVPTLKEILLLDGDKKDSDGEHVHVFRDLKAGSNGHTETRPTPSDIATLIYTSGTTGTPKGVLLSHSNLCSNVNAIHEILPFNENDSSLSFLPWAHSFGQTVELHGMYSAGASMGIAESITKIVENLAEVKPTVLFSVPRIFNKIYQAVQKQLSEKPGVIRALVKTALEAAENAREGRPVSFVQGIALSLAQKLVFEKVRARFGGKLQYAFSGGAAISREVAGFIDGIGITVYQGYGLTETSPIATANFKGHSRVGSIGRPIPGVTIEIDTKATEGKKTQDGYEEGEIVVYGPNVMQGYFKRPEETAAVFLPEKHGQRGFRTGDMGYTDKDGFSFITGRIKEQYKLENGKYVVPTPLEEAIKLSPFVLNTLVYGDNRPHNVALIVLSVDAVRAWAEKTGVSLPKEVEDLVKAEPVRKRLQEEVQAHSGQFKGFEAIRDFALIGEDFTVENGLLTPSQKVKRRAVVDRYQKLIDQLYKRATSSSSAHA